MYQELKKYSKEIDELIAKKERIDEEVIKNHLIKIHFFQHERQIHLMVTLTYGIFLLGSIFTFLLHPIFMIVPFLLIGFLIPYVVHYFHLENGTQYLYKQYDQLLLLKNSKHKEE